MSTPAERHRWKKQRRIERRASGAVLALRTLFGAEVLASVHPTYKTPIGAEHAVPRNTGKTLASRDPYQSLNNIDARVKQANNGRTVIGNPDEGPSLSLDTSGSKGGSTKRFLMSPTPEPKYAQGKPGIKAKRGSSSCPACC